MAVEGMTTLDSQLAVAAKPIIGLEHVVEYIDPTTADSGIRIYNCTLCCVFRTVATILEHVCSFNHRVRTIVSVVGLSPKFGFNFSVFIPA